jgi:hypothetical protein
MDHQDIEVQIYNPNEVEEYLNKFPPDWEAAEKHALANRVADIELTELKLN